MQNGVLSQNKQHAENVVHLSNFCQKIVSDEFKSVFNDSFYQNCRNFPGSMITSGSLNACYSEFFKEDFTTFFFYKSFNQVIESTLKTFNK